MYRNASDPYRQGGFSLVEVLIAMVVSSLLSIAVVRFYKDSYHAYSLQEQLQDRDQNAHFVETKFVELWQQAGSSLPDTGWTVISQAAGTTTIGLNPRGAEQFNGVDLASSFFIPISDAAQWANTGNVLLNIYHVLIDFADPTVSTRKYSIDVSYNANGFNEGIKDNAIGMDSVRITVPVRLAVGDRIYGYREDVFKVTAANLLVLPNGNAAGQMVLAEDIDSLGFTFRDDKGVATANWRKMKSVSFTVRARTSKADPKLPAPGYRKITIPMNVILRNRI